MFDIFFSPVKFKNIFPIMFCSLCEFQPFCYQRKSIALCLFDTIILPVHTCSFLPVCVSICLAFCLQLTEELSRVIQGALLKDNLQFSLLQWILVSCKQISCQEFYKVVLKEFFSACFVMSAMQLCMAQTFCLHSQFLNLIVQKHQGRHKVAPFNIVGIIIEVQEMKMSEQFKHFLMKEYLESANIRACFFSFFNCISDQHYVYIRCAF